MKKKIYLLIFLFFSFFMITACKKKEESVLLDKEYYQESAFLEISKDDLNRFIEEKKNFVLFVYQPLCSTSLEFENILTEFTNEYQITFLKISYANMKETTLNECIQYYPSFVIYQNGEIIDFLEADNDDDIKYYRTFSGFSEWFKKSVVISNNYK